jgi:putative transposase
MKTKRFTEAQILTVLKEYESGISATDLSRKYGIGESTVYAWHSKYAGMELSELKRLRQLEEENNRLKRMYATLSMDHELLKEALGKKLDQDLSGEKWREI